MITVNIGDSAISVKAEPLTQEAFAPFGDVITNPRPNVHPSEWDDQPEGSMPPNASSGNQGTAICYPFISRIRNLCDQAPSGKPVLNRMTMFVCSTTELEGSTEKTPTKGQFRLKIVERHPFTTQTFTPLASAASSYLVMVLPSLPPSPEDEHLPVPSDPAGGDELPGRGLPDVSRLRAFVATNRQAVTYGAGVWHTPMTVLGEKKTSIDFVVSQFATGVAEEDCQLVDFKSAGSDQPRITVQVP